MKFLSKEWIEEFEKAGKAFFGPGTTPSKLSLKLVEVYENVPHIDGGLFWHAYSLKDGVVDEIDSGYDEDDIPTDADYTIYGDYDSYVKVHSGQVALAKAAVSGMFTIEGNMLKGMKMLGTYAQLMKLKALDGRTEW